MRTRAAGAVPTGLTGMRQRFEAWRRNRQGRSHIPERLWASAVKAAATYGLCRTARTLRLDYSALKRHVAVSGGAAPGPRTDQRRGATLGPAPDDGAPFIELAPPARHVGSECLLELEDAGGAKLRLYLKGAVLPDLAALSRSFWSAEP